MGEFDHIAWIRQRTPSSPQVLVGPGDDCAVVAALTPQPWLVTTDMLLEGSHFLLAENAAAPYWPQGDGVNLSDIAAMGGTPVAAVVSLGLPRHKTQAIAEELYLGMREVADPFSTAIAGGDTNTWDGGLVLSVTLFGTPGPQGPILPQRRRPGDWLFVTGPLGEASSQALRLHAAHPGRPGVARARVIHAMIDISDGLCADVFHPCEEADAGCAVRRANPHQRRRASHA